MSLARFAFLPLVLALGAGCAFRTATVHVPAPIPAMAAGQLATDVTVTGAEPVDDAVAGEVRAKTTRMMRKAASEHGAPGHVQVSVDLARRVDYLSFLHRDGMAAAFLAFPLLAGMVLDHETIGVDVTVESGGRTFTGHGEGDKDGSLYASGLKRALAVALDRALADAAKH